MNTDKSKLSARLKEYWRKVRAGELPKPVRDPDAPKTFKCRCHSSQIRGSEIILTVYPHGEIGLRELRRRGEYRISTADCLRVAVHIAVNKQIARVKALRKEGFTLGEARRKARKEIVG